MKSEGPLSPAEAARTAACLAKAIHAAHGAEILHRDLKPSNILIASNGTPKISDFGLAKRMDFDEGLTYSSQPLGTPSFMPPEQISRAEGEMSARSDVYGLGATLFFMLTGKPPFEDADPESILKKVRFDPPSRPRALRPEVPIELEAVVLKCLEKKPENRYTSAEELATDLECFLAGGKTAAPQLTPLRRVRKWIVRNRVAIASGVVVAAVGLLMITVPAAGDYTINAKLELITSSGTTINGTDQETPIHVTNNSGSGVIIVLPPPPPPPPPVPPPIVAGGASAKSAVLAATKRPGANPAEDDANPCPPCRTPFVLTGTYPSVAADPTTGMVVLNYRINSGSEVIEYMSVPLLVGSTLASGGGGGIVVGNTFSTVFPPEARLPGRHFRLYLTGVMGKILYTTSGAVPPA